MFQNIAEDIHVHPALFRLYARRTLFGELRSPIHRIMALAHIRNLDRWAADHSVEQDDGTFSFMRLSLSEILFAEMPDAAPALLASDSLRSLL